MLSHHRIGKSLAHASDALASEDEAVCHGTSRYKIRGQEECTTSCKRIPKMTALIMLCVCINILGSTVCVSRIAAEKEKSCVTACAGHGTEVNSRVVVICQMVIYDTFRCVHCNDYKPTIHLFDAASVCFE